uniref:Uncharacterized protein n=1 Tax=Oryza barthii TaxID=65489 RepID=A0A0D3H276_9ORYZ
MAAAAGEVPGPPEADPLEGIIMFTLNLADVDKEQLTLILYPSCANTLLRGHHLLVEIAPPHPSMVIYHPFLPHHARRWLLYHPFGGRRSFYPATYPGKEWIYDIILERGSFLESGFRKTHGRNKDGSGMNV